MKLGNINLIIPTVRDLLLIDGFRAGEIQVTSCNIYIMARYEIVHNDIILYKT